MLRKGCSIGANATILPGIEIGAGAMIGAGTVVTRSVPPHAIAIGNPARITGYVDAVRDAVPAAPRAPAAAGAVRSLGVGGVALHELPLIEDMRGNLSVGEFAQSVPFVPQRYFLVLDVPSLEVRGEHAHRKCMQFLVCVRGSCAIVVDDGSRRAEVLLDRPNMGLFLPPMVWGIQYKYSSDAVLLVFASEHYDPHDYIRDYAEYRRLVDVRPA
jgi:dTDP-4-dehydrorhamnose 3,5-epimerase-like enzyme